MRHYVSQDFAANVSHLVAKRDTSDKFNKGLPSKDKFFNLLTKREISNRNYEHYVNVL